ncbi:phospholipase D-like domain-containing protein [Bacteroides sp. GM023]|uniref:phospholipase D-like domain-containing protein n=1 Tax=Bacteroides sp. GM023 TaxID=2723058 RepID=UPI00168A67F8|nr:phospholipase D-like domain-containing protein [Bacteroides sp. GM023]MBD3592314.1 phospholipase [Bacteroides sp. GM023]
MIRYIQNEQHYKLLVNEVSKVRHTLWIGTADLKDLHIRQGNSVVPFLSILEQKIRQKVSIRLLHAKEPGENFRNDFDKYPLLWKGLERSICPRIHFKILIFDLQLVYIGSANLTGAALGMKSERNRNFEAGIITNEQELVDNAITQFDEIWIGKYCKECGRKNVCKDRIGIEL